MSVERLQSNLRRTLSRAKLKLSRPSFCPDIALYLYDPEALSGPLSHDEAQAVVAEPAYWSFCWASGQVLAQFILDHPDWVRGKTVLDLGSGSGVAAIAAAKAGAARVIACDIDADAREAAQFNAQANGVSITTSDALPQTRSVDLLLAADILYDRDNLPLLDSLPAIANEVLLADSRVKVLPVDYLEKFAAFEARTWPDLNEFEEFNRVRLYCSRGAKHAPNQAG